MGMILRRWRDSPKMGRFFEEGGLQLRGTKNPSHLRSSERRLGRRSDGRREGGATSSKIRGSSKMGASSIFRLRRTQNPHSSEPRPKKQPGNSEEESRREGFFVLPAEKVEYGGFRSSDPENRKWSEFLFFGAGKAKNPPTPKEPSPKKPPPSPIFRSIC